MSKYALEQDPPPAPSHPLWKITTILILAHLVVLLAGRWGVGFPESFGRLFFLDQEYNVPTFYSSLLFVVSAYYCLRLGFKNFQHRLVSFTWILLGGLLIFFAADEWFSIHERLIEPLRSYFGIEQGIFYYSWTIIYIVLVTAIGLLSLPWLRQIDKLLRKKLITAAGIYIFGALVLEMVGSYIYSSGGNEYTPIYANIVTLEESLELIGLTLAALALSRYFGNSKSV